MQVLLNFLLLALMLLPVIGQKPPEDGPWCMMANTYKVMKPAPDRLKTRSAGLKPGFLGLRAEELSRRLNCRQSYRVIGDCQNRLGQR